MPAPTPDRCPKCDQPRGIGSPAGDVQDDPGHCWNFAPHWRSCSWNSVDWRARALAAERQVCRMLSGDTIESDSLCPHEPSEEGLRAIAAERQAAEAEAAIESRAAKCPDARPTWRSPRSTASARSALARSSEPRRSGARGGGGERPS